MSAREAGIFAGGVATGVVIAGVAAYALAPLVAQRVTRKLVVKVFDVLSLPAQAATLLSPSLEREVNIAVREALVP